MSGVKGYLEGSLTTRLEAWKAANSALCSDVFYPNQGATPPEPDATKAWVKASFVPQETRQATVGDDGMNEMGGIMQLSVFAPKGLGAGLANSVVDSLVTYFKRGTNCPAVSGYVARVIAAWADAPIGEDAWYHVPVRIRWFQHVQNV